MVVWLRPKQKPMNGVVDGPADDGKTRGIPTRCGVNAPVNADSESGVDTTESAAILLRAGIGT
jgi:hypothetical protein